MPFDTHNLRASAVHVSLPWRGMFPLPDGTLDQADRQQILLLYAGILSGEATPPVIVAVARGRAYAIAGGSGKARAMRGASGAAAAIAGGSGDARSVSGST